MAKELYVSVNGLSKKTIQWYCSVNGVTKRVIAAYCSVNGLTKQFYGAGGEQETGWQYYATVSGVFVITPQYSYPKTDNGIAYFCLFKRLYGGRIYISPMLVSPDADAVKYQYGSSTATAQGVLSVNGDNWYYSGMAGALQWSSSDVYDPDCLLSDEAYELPTLGDFQTLTGDFIQKIYENCFAKNYQIRSTYTLDTADPEKWIRRAIGIYLYKNYQYKGEDFYNTILSRKEDIISSVLNYCNNAAIIGLTFSISLFGATTKLEYVFTFVIQNNYSPTAIYISGQNERNGYKYYNGDLSYSNLTQVKISGTTGVSVSSSTTSGSGITIGTNISYQTTSWLPYGRYLVYGSSLGITL